MSTRAGYSLTTAGKAAAKKRLPGMSDDKSALMKAVYNSPGDSAKGSMKTSKPKTEVAMPVPRPSSMPAAKTAKTKSYAPVTAGKKMTPVSLPPSRPADAPKSGSKRSGDLGYYGRKESDTDFITSGASRKTKKK